MERLTIQTKNGAALKLNSPKTEQEAREQLMATYKVAINKLAAYEDTRLTPEAVKRVNTFAGSELEKMLVKNGELTRELEIAKKAICEMCQRRAQEQNIICGCVRCKYRPREEA